MLDPAVLMRRAVREVCDQHDLTPDSLKLFDHVTQGRFQDLSIETANDMAFHQLKYFRPFEHQLEFFKTVSSRRGILAANRIGKTVSTCFETAMHLTGQYPEWWEGHKFNKPITVMVAGEGWSQVALVLQQELLGTPDIKL